MHYQNSWWLLRSPFVHSLAPAKGKAGLCRWSHAIILFAWYEESQIRLLFLSKHCNAVLILQQETSAKTGVSTNAGIKNWYTSLQIATHSLQSLAGPYQPSLRTFSFPHPKLWTVRWGCRAGRAGKVCGAQKRASANLCSFMESFVTLVEPCIQSLQPQRLLRLIGTICKGPDCSHHSFTWPLRFQLVSCL